MGVTVMPSTETTHSAVEGREEEGSETKEVREKEQELMRVWR